MVNVKEKDNGSTSIPNPEKDSTKTAVTETAVSETKTILEKTVAVSETEEKVEQITEGAKTEENASEEKDNGANAEEEEADEEIDEEGTNEENSQDGEEEEEEEEENKDDNLIEEDIAEEKKEEENSDNNPMEEDIDEEKKEEEMKEEKAEPVSKEPVKKSRKRSRNKAVAAKDQDKPESSVKRTPAKKAKTVAAKDENGPASVGKKTPSTKAKTVGGPESSGRKKPPKEGKDTPESSGKKKPSKKVESMGMIFMCSSKTKKDCYRYKVLGLPASKKETVQKIYKGMRLFLYDVDLKMMYGIYKAAAPGGFNIEPKAFNSAYPSQVRFTVLEECEPLDEEKFKKVIKENYYSKNKFDCQLNSDQVKNLCKLFAFASKGTPKSKKAARSARAEPRPSSGRGRIRRGVRDEPRPRSPRGPPRGAPRGARRYNDRPMVYEREAFVPPMAPMHNVQPLPARVPAPPLPYAYEMDAYGRDPPPEHRGRPFLDYERDRYNYREQEPLSYHDPVYSAGRPREYNYAPPAEYNYVPPPALPSRYHYPDPASDYRSSAGVRAEYHIPAEVRRADYRSSARDRVYRL